MERRAIESLAAGGLTWAVALFFALIPSVDLQMASVLFLTMTVAYLMADCAADAALVGLSTREPLETRGSILSTAYCIRFSFNICSAAVCSLHLAVACPHRPLLITVGPW
jgi:hypothetical protein